MKHYDIKQHTITFKTSCGRTISNHHIVDIEDALKGTAFDIRLIGPDTPQESREQTASRRVKVGLQDRKTATVNRHLRLAWDAIWRNWT